MDEMDRVQTKLAALAQAQGAMLNQQPPNIAGFRKLAMPMSDLQSRLMAFSSQPVIPLLDDSARLRLEQAVRVLAAAVIASAGATQILEAATAIINS